MKKVVTICLSVFLALATPSLFSGEVKDDQTVILPSSYGWYANGEINVSIHGWVFEMEERSALRTGFINLLKDQFDKSSADEKKIFERRLRYFLVDNKRGRDIRIIISGDEFTLPATSPDGHILSTIKITDRPEYKKGDGFQEFYTINKGGGNKTFTGRFQVIGEKGYSVISDIDDTIKVSNVHDKKELAKNTFFREFAPVKGMPEFYRKLKDNGAVFHYVSGSPWQLYPEIDSFLAANGFPDGAVELKLFRVKDRSSIGFITADQFSYKVSRIKTIIDRFPRRKFILIGDSGEKDPEVYAEIARLYGERIRFIFIRDVGLIEESGSRRKGVAEKAGKIRLIIFKQPDELTPYLKMIRD